MGIGKDEVMKYVDMPVIIPEIRKGKKNCKNLER
jgi:hypothetical protein